MVVTELKLPCSRKRYTGPLLKRKRGKAQIKVDPNKCPLCCGIFQKGEEGKCHELGVTSAQDGSTSAVLTN